MNKSVVTTFAVLLLVPNMVFAAWWNPFSWAVFSSSLQTKQQPQITTATSTTTLAASTTQTNSENKSVKKVEPKTLPKATIQLPTTTTRVPNSQPTKPAGTACNGVYWSACPSGQDLVCPPIGDAYCQPPQQKPISIPSSSTQPQQTDPYQFFIVKAELESKISQTQKQIDKIAHDYAIKNGDIWNQPLSSINVKEKKQIKELQDEFAIITTQLSNLSKYGTTTYRSSQEIQQSVQIVDITAVDSIVQHGQPTTIKWTSTNSTSCRLNSSPVLLATEGSQLTGSLNTTTTFRSNGHLSSLFS